MVYVDYFGHIVLAERNLQTNRVLPRGLQLIKTLYEIQIFNFSQNFKDFIARFQDFSPKKIVVSGIIRSRNVQS